MTQSDDEFVSVDAGSAVTSNAQTLSGQSLVNQKTIKVLYALVDRIRSNVDKLKTTLETEPPKFLFGVWPRILKYDYSGQSLENSEPTEEETLNEMHDELEGLEKLSYFNSGRESKLWVSEESEMKRSLLQEARAARTLKEGDPAFGIARRLAKYKAVPWPVTARIATKVDKARNYKVEAEVVFEGDPMDLESIERASNGIRYPRSQGMTDKGTTMQELLKGHSEAFGGRINIL